MAELQSQILNNVMLTTLVSDSDQITQFVEASIRETSADVPDMSKLNLTYESTEEEKKISLSYNGRELGSIDASGFVKDGMVSSVLYDEESRELTIKWNADAGRPDEKISLSGLLDAYTAGEGLSLSNREFSLTADIPSKVSELENDSGYATSAYVDGSCEALSSGLTGWVDGRGYLVPEDVRISYDGGERRIVLSSGGAITSIDCGDFIKDGMISDVSYDEATHVLSILWNSDGGSKVTEVNLSGLLDTYTAGYGLTCENGEFSLTANIPSKVSELENDSGYATSAYVDGSCQNLSNGLTGWVEDQNYLTEHQSLSDYYAKSETSSAAEISGALAGKQPSGDYATSAYVNEQIQLSTHHYNAGDGIIIEPYGPLSPISQTIHNVKIDEDYTATKSYVRNTVDDVVISALSDVAQYESYEQVPLSAIFKSLWQLSRQSAWPEEEE